MGILHCRLSLHSNPAHTRNNPHTESIYKNTKIPETGRRIPLRELLMNEGLAVHVSRAVSPGHAAWEYFGYDRREYARVREMESIISRSLIGNLDKTGLGLRLKYLSDGMTDERRRAGEQVLPERSGYYLGAKMVEHAIATRGYAWTIRASALEITSAGSEAAETA